MNKASEMCSYDWEIEMRNVIFTQRFMEWMGFGMG